MNLRPPSIGDSLAAEYALGTLHGPARRRFEQLLQAHPGLRRAVADWERRMGSLVTACPPVPPPPAVWNSIEKRLFPPPPRRAWWDSLALWRTLAAAGVLAAVVAVAPRLTVSPPELEHPFATIRDAHRDVLWTVALADDGRLQVNNLRPMAMPPDQHCLLWLKFGDSPPIMLGVLPDDGGVRILTLPAGMAQPAQGELWVTMQPVAPSPQPPARPLYQTRWQTL